MNSHHGTEFRVTVFFLLLSSLLISQSLSTQLSSHPLVRTAGRTVIGSLSANPSMIAEIRDQVDTHGMTNGGIVVCADLVEDPARMMIATKEPGDFGASPESMPIVLAIPGEPGSVTHWAMACPPGDPWTYILMGCFEGPSEYRQYLVMFRYSPDASPLTAPLDVSTAAVLSSTVLPPGAPPPTSCTLTVFPRPLNGDAVVWCTVPDGAGDTDVRQFVVQPPIDQEGPPTIETTTRDSLRARISQASPMAAPLVVSKLRLAPARNGILHAVWQTPRTEGGTALLHACLEAAEATNSNAPPWRISEPTQFATEPPAPNVSSACGSSGSPPAACPPSPGNGAPALSAALPFIGFFGAVGPLTDGPIRITASLIDDDMHVVYVGDLGTTRSLLYRRYWSECCRFGPPIPVPSSWTDGEPEEIDIRSDGTGDVSIIARVVRTQEVRIELARLREGNSEFSPQDLLIASEHPGARDPSFLDCAQSAVVGLFTVDDPSLGRALHALSRLTSSSTSRLATSIPTVVSEVEGIAFDVEASAGPSSRALLLDRISVALAPYDAGLPVEVWVSFDPRGAAGAPISSWALAYAGTIQVQSEHGLTELPFPPQWLLGGGRRMSLFVRSPGRAAVRIGEANGLGVAATDQFLRISAGYVRNELAAAIGPPAHPIVALSYGPHGTSPRFQINSRELGLDICRAEGDARRAAAVEICPGGVLPVALRHRSSAEQIWIAVGSPDLPSVSGAPLHRSAGGRILNLDVTSGAPFQFFPIDWRASSDGSSLRLSRSAAIPIPDLPSLIGTNLRVQALSIDSSSEEGFCLSQPVDVAVVSDPKLFVPGPISHEPTSYRLPPEAPSLSIFGHTYRNLWIDAHGRVCFGSLSGTSTSSGAVGNAANFRAGPPAVGLWVPLAPSPSRPVVIHYAAGELRIRYEQIPTADGTAEVSFEIVLTTPEGPNGGPTTITIQGLESVVALPPSIPRVLGVTPGAWSSPVGFTVITSAAGSQSEFGPLCVELLTSGALPDWNQISFQPTSNGRYDWSAR